MGPETRNDSQATVALLSQALVDQLKKEGFVRTPRVEAAFLAVPRHLFVPGTPLEEVFADQHIVTKRAPDGRALSSSSQPAIMAIMLEQLGLQPGHKVLEIGAGTGYNAALVAHIVGETGQVVTVDIDEDIVEAAREHLDTVGLDRVQVVCTDGGYGYPDAAPYDRMILSVAAPDITPAWMEQLRPGGRLVLPLVTPEGGQRSVAFERTGDYLTSLSIRRCGFMRLRGAFAVSSPMVARDRIQLGPDPGLTISVQKGIKIDAEKAYRWLTAAHRDWETGVQVSLQELAELPLWLAIHLSGLSLLVAQGDMANRDMVPSLFETEGEQKGVATNALVGEKGLVALMRPPNRSGRPVDFSEPSMLFVREFGSAPPLVRRFFECIGAWNDAGRSSYDGLRIRVYPKDVDRVPSENEYVLESQWARFAFDYPKVP